MPTITLNLFFLILEKAVSPDNGGAPAYRWASEELQKDPDVIAATKKGNLADDFDEDEGLYL